MKFTIPVTAEHIADGMPGVCRSCPVALAITQSLPDVLVHVSYELITLWGSRQGERVETPFAVQEFIGRFDSALQVEPFEFVLDIPGHLVPAGAVPAGGEH